MTDPAPAPEKDIVTRGYSLPRETYDALVNEAGVQQRNVSNMLTVIVNDYFTRRAALPAPEATPTVA